MLHRFGIRFAALFIFLNYLPEPFGSLPKIDEAVYDGWNAAWRPIASVAASLIGVELPDTGTTGIGDGLFEWLTLLAFLVISIVVAFAWSFDKRRTNDPKVLDVTRDYLRIVLMLTLVSYGWGKAFRLQMEELDEALRATTYGESSPMGLLWRFMGASPSYQHLTGYVELIGGLLLLNRRTTTLGAIVVVGAMSNVFALNLFYDVPVKIGSARYLLSGLFLAAPDLLRIIGLLVFRKTTEPRDDAPKYLVGPRTRWVRMAAFPAMALIALYGQTIAYDELMAQHPMPPKPTSSLTGVYVPLTQATPTNWLRVTFTRFFSMRSVDGGETEFGQFTVNEAEHTVTITQFMSGPNPAQSTLSWAFEGNDLLLRGKYRDQDVDVRMRKLDTSKDLLITRGFHWVQEYPFNR